jgi:hypothetical protein
MKMKPIGERSKSVVGLGRLTIKKHRGKGKGKQCTDSIVYANHGHVSFVSRNLMSNKYANKVKFKCTPH